MFCNIRLNIFLEKREGQRQSQLFLPTFGKKEGKNKYIMEIQTIKFSTSFILEKKKKALVYQNGVFRTVSKT